MVSITVFILSDIFSCFLPLIDKLSGSPPLNSVSVVREHNSLLFMVRDSELFVGMILYSSALPQYLTRAMLIGERSLTKYSSISVSWKIQEEADCSFSSST